MKISLIKYLNLLIHGGKTRAKVLDVKYLGGLDSIKKNVTGIFIIKDKGLFFQYSFNIRMFVATEDIIEINLENNALHISINKEGTTCILKFTHEEEAPLINMYNFIQKILPEDRKKNLILIETRTVLETPYIPLVQVSAVEKPKKITERDRLKQFKKERIPYCPKCHSTSLQYVERRKQLSVGRAIVGGTIASIIDPVGTGMGMVLGGLSSKKYKGNIKCLNCGHMWKK